MLEPYEQIKINGIYYTVTRKDRDMLADMEASLCGCCTDEGVVEFHKAIREVRSRATERNFEFDVYEVPNGDEANSTDNVDPSGIGLTTDELIIDF